MTERILVPLDGSPLAEQAIPFARALAGENGQMTFLHVVPDPEPMRGLFGEILVTADDALRIERETASGLLVETIQRWITVLGKEPSIYITAGDPAEVVLRVAAEVGATMIAIASHGRGMAGRLAFGSVADRIARTSEIPVLIVHPADEAGAEPAPVTITRVVTPLDGSDVAKEALPVAQRIARAAGANLHLMEAINPSALLLPSPVGAAHYPAELYQELLDEMSTGAEQALEGAASEAGADSLTVTRSVVEGPAVQAIESEIHAGDLIVMTSHGRSGFRRWLLGSVSEKLIRSGIAPVVLVPAEARVAAGRES